MQTEKYTRKPFNVEAVQVTADNIFALAAWCEGEVITKTLANGSVPDYIHVDVHHPVNEKQSQAYVGDWLLFANRGWKVYTDKAFKKTFVKLNEETGRPVPVIHVEKPRPKSNPATIPAVTAADGNSADRVCMICGTKWVPSPSQMTCPNASTHPGATA